MFQSIGERFNIGITGIVERVKRCLRLEQKTVSETELTTLASILCISVLLGGAGAFHHYEHWQFADAFYYCFITMSTIGFGDFVALQNNSMEALQKKPEYVAFSIIYILFGLTVFAAALNLMVLRLLTMNTLDERKDKLQALADARNAVKVNGDVITPGAKNNGMVSLSDEEGIQMEADESLTDLHTHISTPSKLIHANSHIYGATNGILMHQSRKGSAGKKVTGLFNHLLHRSSTNNKPNQAVLWTDSSDNQRQVLIVQSGYTNDAPTQDYLNRKRSSV